MATFTQTFDDSTGFVFNATEVEFVASVCRLVNLGGDTYTTRSEVILPQFSNDPIGYIQSASDVVGMEGTLGYQVSEDGVNFKYWDGSEFAAVITTEDNDINTLSANIKDFQIPGNEIYIKVILKSDGSQQTEIDTFSMTYPAEVPVVSFESKIF